MIFLIISLNDFLKYNIFHKIVFMLNSNKNEIYLSNEK